MVPYQEGLVFEATNLGKGRGKLRSTPLLSASWKRLKVRKTNGTLVC